MLQILSIYKFSLNNWQIRQVVPFQWSDLVYLQNFLHSHRCNCERLWFYFCVCFYCIDGCALFVWRECGNNFREGSVGHSFSFSLWHMIRQVVEYWIFIQSYWWRRRRRWHQQQLNWRRQTIQLSKNNNS